MGEYQNHATCNRKGRKKCALAISPPHQLSQCLQMFSFWLSSLLPSVTLPLVLILFLTFLDSQSWPPDFLVTNTTSLSAWHPLEDYCFALASENFLGPWPWQPPLTAVYLEKGGRAEAPTQKHLCWCPFTQIYLEYFSSFNAGYQDGLMLLFYFFF